MGVGASGENGHLGHEGRRGGVGGAAEEPLAGYAQGAVKGLRRGLSGVWRAPKRRDLPFTVRRGANGVEVYAGAVLDHDREWWVGDEGSWILIDDASGPIYVVLQATEGGEDIDRAELSIQPGGVWSVKIADVSRMPVDQYVVGHIVYTPEPNTPPLASWGASSVDKVGLVKSMVLGAPGEPSSCSGGDVVAPCPPLASWGSDGSSVDKVPGLITGAVLGEPGAPSSCAGGTMVAPCPPLASWGSDGSSVDKVPGLIIGAALGEPGASSSCAGGTMIAPCPPLASCRTSAGNVVSKVAGLVQEVKEDATLDDVKLEDGVLWLRKSPVTKVRAFDGESIDIPIRNLGADKIKVASSAGSNSSHRWNIDLLISKEGETLVLQLNSDIRHI